jgi:hypothetical protein
MGCLVVRQWRRPYSRLIKLVEILLQGMIRARRDHDAEADATFRRQALPGSPWRLPPLAPTTSSPLRMPLVCSCGARRGRAFSAPVGRA